MIQLYRQKILGVAHAIALLYLGLSFIVLVALVLTEPQGELESLTSAPLKPLEALAFCSAKETDNQ